VFLTALLGKISDTKNPFALGSIADSMTGGLRIDDAMHLFDAMGLAFGLRGFSPESATLPTTNANHAGQSALDLDKAKASPVIQQFAA